MLQYKIIAIAYRVIALEHQNVSAFDSYCISDKSINFRQSIHGFANFVRVYMVLTISSEYTWFRQLRQSILGFDNFVRVYMILTTSSECTWFSQLPQSIHGYSQYSIVSHSTD
jgi:hypothetical protein